MKMVIIIIFLKTIILFLYRLRLLTENTPRNYVLEIEINKMKKQGIIFSSIAIFLIKLTLVEITYCFNLTYIETYVSSETKVK